jgi:hypothetical protein
MGPPAPQGPRILVLSRRTPQSLVRFCCSALAGLGLLPLGCHGGRDAGAAPPRPPPAPAGAAEVAPGAASRDTPPGEFRTVELRAVPARVTIPDPGSWRAARDGSFVVLEQRSTNSRIVLRVWKAARLVRPAECEAEARLLRPALPRADPQTLLDARRIAAPADYDVHLVVGVEETSGRGVHGFAIAVGAAVGRCYLGEYETRAEGSHAAELVADRLATMVPGFIETVVVEGAEVRARRAGPAE